MDLELYGFGDQQPSSTSDDGSVAKSHALLCVQG
jgi:hypothetical protein